MGYFEKVVVIGVLIFLWFGSASAQDSRARAISNSICETEAQLRGKMAVFWSDDWQNVEKVIREKLPPNRFTEQQIAVALNKAMRERLDLVFDKTYEHKLDLRKILENQNKSDPALVELYVVTAGLVFQQAGILGIKQPGLSELRYKRLLEEDCKKTQ